VNSHKTTEGEDRASLIVRAVNSHEAMKEALEKLLPGAEAMGWNTDQARAA